MKDTLTTMDEGWHDLINGPVTKIEALALVMIGQSEIGRRKILYYQIVAELGKIEDVFKEHCR